MNELRTSGKQSGTTVFQSSCESLELFRCSLELLYLFADVEFVKCFTPAEFLVLSILPEKNTRTLHQFQNGWFLPIYFEHNTSFCKQISDINTNEV